MACPSGDGTEIVIKKAIRAHGGWDSWENLDTIRYTKTFNLYLEDGSVEREIVEKHQTIIHPAYQNHITRKDGSILSFDGKNYSKTLRDSSMQVTAADTGLIYSSIFVIGQPFKLRDPGIKISYEGIDTLFNGKEVISIKAEYQETGKENHPWWFFFDPDTHRCVANMVDHNGSFSLITNNEYVEYKGILWNKKRTGYRTDAEGKLLYKRADYIYDFQ